MSIGEDLKWWRIRSWPLGYRLASRVSEALDRESRPELQRHCRFFGSFVRPGDLCFDVGANRGARTEVLLRLGAEVVAVEPQPHCVARLQARFGAKKRFQVVSKALGARHGEATLHLGNIDLISTLSRDWLDYAQQVPDSIIAKIGWEGTLTVPLITLDALIATHGVPDFFKIDVEGYELEVLKGLGQPIPLVSLEYTHGRLQLTLDCISRLTELGEYVFNLSELESMEMSCDEWVSADEVAAMLVDRFGKREFGYGDVYARSSTRPSKNNLNPG